MAVHKGIVKVPTEEVAPVVPNVPRKVLVRLKKRSILEPGCITVDPGFVTEIPEAHFSPEHHELVNPPAVGEAPNGPPAAEGSDQPPAVSDADLTDVRLFEDPK